MSTIIYRDSAPLCANAGCANHTNKSPKKYKIPKYTKYCSKECRLIGQGIERSKTMAGISARLIIPKCANITCGNDVINRVGYKWNQCCSQKCAAAVGIPKGLTKRIITNTERYGGKSPMNSDSVKQTYRIRFTEKYGVENPGQVSSIRNRAINTGKNKEYILPSGRIIKIQGFEGNTLDELLLKYNEDDIIVGSSGNVPVIKYINELEKNSIYFPDFHIPKDNLILETKSLYWYEKFKEKNLLKEKACIAAGFNFKWMIY